MNGRTTKLLKKYSRMTKIDSSRLYTSVNELKRTWKHQMDRDDRTDARVEMKNQLREFNEKENYDQEFFVPN